MLAYLRYLFWFFLLLFLSNSMSAQRDFRYLYSGLGYSIQAGVNNDLNALITNYNTSLVENPQFTVDQEFGNLLLYNGPDAILGWKFGNQRLIYETHISYRRASVLATGSFVDDGSSWRDQLTFNQYTAGLGYLFPIYHDDVLQIAAGALLDMSLFIFNQDLQSNGRSENIVLLREPNLGITPLLHFYLNPIPRSNVMFGIKPYFQFNLIPVDLGDIETILLADARPELKQGGSELMWGGGLSLEILFKSKSHGNNFFKTFLKNIKLKRNYKRSLKRFKKSAEGDGDTYVTFGGKIQDAVTGDSAIDAFVVVTDTIEKVATNISDVDVQTGKFTMFLSAISHKRYVVQGAGYMPKMGLVNPEMRQESGSYFTHIDMVPITVGDFFTLPLDFEEDAENLTEEGENALETGLEFMAHNPEVKVEITTLPVLEASEEVDAEKLARARLKKVREIMEEKGIKGNRIKLNVEEAEEVGSPANNYKFIITKHN